MQALHAEAVKSSANSTETTHKDCEAMSRIISLVQRRIKWATQKDWAAQAISHRVGHPPRSRTNRAFTAEQTMVREVVLMAMMTTSTQTSRAGACTRQDHPAATKPGKTRLVMTPACDGVRRERREDEVGEEETLGLKSEDVVGTTSDVGAAAEAMTTRSPKGWI